MDYNQRKKIMPIQKILYSIDNLLIEGKEQKLKVKIARKIKNSIFVEEIISKLNECDFTGLIDEEDNILKLFDSIFPIFITKDNITFRLYKHKIEVDLSDNMKDRYIYMFSDGRLTSGLFQCYSISDDEYVYRIKKIIDIIPLIKEELLSTISSFRKNIENKNIKMINIKKREELAEKNYDELNSYFLVKNLSK